ncbi:PTS glucitol/sorbitol transporter subunit IIA [Alkalicoccobacillus plakortidis]|uniref:PTS glucitol/sorbitol transporter subunit IIA n=1 Tax=Alkalicoccobacillus plakortidis TaxID=444060 RepID=A0ABT0XJQ7_9BACI|nr:PTS glucitol/sorbitol transporter subunit IIA [Alkalicoccobacillus plakortidis]MCM2676131.1 PTS glucitol/sorbitol transporter subunit IIA [Alkalicoccobacillus plakortidis]
MEQTKTTVYQSEIIELGSQTGIFLEENMLVIFNETVPADLKDISAIHKKTELLHHVVVGDTLQIQDNHYKILFVGEKANETLRDLGHCTIEFSGKSFSDLPGTLCVEKKVAPNLEIGGKIAIYRG